MAQEQHLEILNQGVEHWNRWRKQHPESKPDLCGANLINRDLSRVDFSAGILSRADLSKAQLSHANLHAANLESSTLILADLLGAILNESNLSAASLFGAFLFGTRLKGANLSGANLMGASLMGADLSSANLTGAHLMGANFHDANLAKANLTNANLTAASLVGAKVGDALLSNCSVYGVSAFNLDGIPKVQSNLIITPLGESPIAVSELETAQLVYLLVSGSRVSRILESVQSKLVLVVGNFRSEREGVLTAIQKALTQQGLVAIVAHFAPPITRVTSERILKLVKFARLILVDLTESNQLQRFVSESWADIRKAPVQQLIQDGWFQQHPRAPIDIDDAGVAPLVYRASEDLQELLRERLSVGAP